MVLKLDIKVRNLEAANRAIARMNTKFKNISMMNFGKAIAKRAVSELKRRTKYKYPSDAPGRLAASIKTVSVERGRRVFILADAENEGFPYAASVEFGRRSVSAVNAPFMIFRGYKGDILKFRGGTSVRGTKGYRFMQRAAEWGRKEIKKYMEARIERIIKSKGTIDDFNIAETIFV